MHKKHLLLFAGAGLVITFAVIAITIFASRLGIDRPQHTTQQLPFAQEESEAQADQGEAADPLAITDMLLPHTSSTERDDAPYTHVMIHFASNAPGNPEAPHDVNVVYHTFSLAEVGAHYYIDREGKIYRFVDESRMAFHTGPGSLPGFPELSERRNYYVVGIELAAIGSEREMRDYFGMDAATYARIPRDAIGYTDAQYEALQNLLDDVITRYDIPYTRQHIIGHDEWAPATKTDPGELFEWGRLGL